MKKWYFILLVLGFWCCDDMLRVEPENSLTFGNITTEKDIESLVLGVGASVRSMVCWNALLQVEKGAYADEVDESRRGARMLELEAGTADNWEVQYQVIMGAQNVLDYVDIVDMPSNRRDYYKGAAYFFKALGYYDLLHRFGDCILQKGGVNWQPVAKTSWPVVCEFAIEMAEKAVDLLPEFDKLTDCNGQSVTSKSTPCKGAANALLAQLCAWKAGCKWFAREEDKGYDEKLYWEKAEKACTEVIKSPLYELAADPEEVCSSVLVGNSKEGIYETVMKDYFNEVGARVFSLGTDYVGYPVRPEYAPGVVKDFTFRIFTTSVREMYPGNDKRKYAYFYDLDGMDAMDKEITGGFAYPYKERSVNVTVTGSKKKFASFNSNKIWWRLADIYLLRAEARYHLGDEDGAIADMNEIRDRAGAARYNSSEYNGDLQRAIFKEREKELLMEGYRYYDIMRNGLEYVQLELEGGYKTATVQDYIDGAFFLMNDELDFKENPLMRQNLYWLKRQ